MNELESLIERHYQKRKKETLRVTRELRKVKEGELEV